MGMLKMKFPDGNAKVIAQGIPKRKQRTDMKDIVIEIKRILAHQENGVPL